MSRSLSKSIRFRLLLYIFMNSDQDRYFNCLENCHYHEQFETPKRICLAALTDDPFDNPKVSIDQNLIFNIKKYDF